MCSHYATINVVTGKAKITCEANRDRSGGDFCGTMGRFFVSKKPVPVQIIEADIGLK